MSVPMRTPGSWVGMDVQVEDLTDVAVSGGGMGTYLVL